MQLNRVVSSVSQLQIHYVVDGKDEVSPQLEEEEDGHGGDGRGKDEVSITKKSVTKLTIKLTRTLH